MFDLESRTGWYAKEIERGWAFYGVQKGITRIVGG